MNRASSHSIRLIISLACLLIVYAYGVRNLKTFPIGHDETNTAFNLFSTSMDQRFNAIETLESVSARSPQHGPLYFIVLNLWNSLAGEDLFVWRLLSVYFAVIAVSVAYRVALISGRRDGALTAAILLSSLAFFLSFTHIARMYTLLPILAGWLVWSVWQVVNSGGSMARWKWLSLFLSITAIIYTHYFSIVMVAAVGAYLLLHVRKDRRWLQTVIVMAASGLMFTPWLPVVARGLEGGAELPPVRLSLIDSLYALSSIFSNGLLFPLLAAGTLALIYRHRLNERERYLMLVGGYSILMALLLNELTPILFTSRMRYATVLALPVCVAVAASLRYLPHWRTLRIPALLLWMAASIAYFSSDDFASFTASRGQLYETGLYFQDFIYQAQKLPGRDELILSIHVDDNRHHSVSKVLQYYRAILSDWKHIVSIWQEDHQGEGIFSGLPAYASKDAIAANSKGLWLIHNPRHTDLKNLPIYKSWFSQQYKPCKRFQESEVNIIEYYIAFGMPCELRLSPKPFAISYDNGSELANIMVEKDAARLMIYAWWQQTQFGVYAYTTQLYDRDGAKIGPQSDDLIGNSGLYARSLDISSLPAGEYVVKIIVYDYASHKSQPGTIVLTRQRFEREVEIARFSIPG